MTESCSEEEDGGSCQVVGLGSDSFSCRPFADFALAFRTPLKKQSRQFLLEERCGSN